MKETNLFFDLDGTLSDSAPGITRSVAYALAKMGRPPMPEAELFDFVGPPLAETFGKKCGMDEDEVLRAIRCYREYYETKGIYENEPYAGVGAMLRTLRKVGKTLILATSKPEKFARQILERYGFASDFTFIGGAGMNERTRMRKDEVIRYCMESRGIDASCVDDCLMIGDRCHDVQGAASVGMKTVGVLYGYGSQKELEDAGAVRLCGTVAQLTACLLD